MKCQNCKTKTQTKDTRQYRDTELGFNWVERRVFCSFCKVTTKTIEIPMDVWMKYFENSDDN
jgi:transcriptional regulator NrdR family protein